jgi:tetratricopeptide (TPR) repeat protein
MGNRKIHAFLKFAFLAALVWLAYWGSLHGPFAFDDWHVIPQNPSVRGPSDIPSFFKDPTTFSLLVANRDYRPVFLTSMALCWSAGGGSTFPFHVVSVFLHMSNVLLLFLILRRCFASGRDHPGAWAVPHAEWAALLASTLFAVHPLASESINYISSQSVPLAALFYLLSFYLFCTVYDERDGSSGWSSRGRRVACYMAYFLALLSKPIAITLPLILVLWDLLIGGRTPQPEGGSPSAWMRSLFRIRKHLPFVAVTILYLSIRSVVLSGSPGPTEAVRPILTHYLTQASALVFFYFKLALVPLGLNVDPEYPLATSFLDPRVMVSLAVLAILAGLLVRFRRHRVLVFWSLWFPSCLLITTFAVVLPQVVNEHRVYLSLAGFCAVVGLLFFQLWSSFPITLLDLSIGARSGRRLIGALMLGGLVALAFATQERTRVWSSDLTLWEDSVQHGGSWRPHMNYALALEAAGRSDEALEHFEEAVELGPYAFPHLNLGNALITRGDYDRGLSHLRTAVQLWPSLPEARLYLGYGLGRAGLVEEAEQEMLAALDLRPDYLKGHEYIARLYEEQGEADKALAAYQRLYDLGTRDPDVLFRLGFAHQKRGDREQAIRIYEELLEVAPAHRQGNFNLAYAYKNGDSPAEWSRSATLFRQVLSIDPDYHEALHHLATTQWNLGNAAEAAEYDSLYLEHGQHESLKIVSQERLASRAHDGAPDQ